MNAIQCKAIALAAALLAAKPGVTVNKAAAHYPLVGTAQDQCYADDGKTIACPPKRAAMSGQDAQHPGSPPSYRDNGDSTVSDLVTGLTWAKAPSSPMPFDDAAAFAAASQLGGHKDWRVPSIRELYSLIDYRGGFTGNPATSRSYIDVNSFTFAYGKGFGLGPASAGRRPIDVQEWSSTEYVGRTMGRDRTIFGVNFADGRIKGYPAMDPANRMQTPHRLGVRLVRGPAYGGNDFEVSGDTVRDRATKLVWQRTANRKARSWRDALQYCQSLKLDNRSDWQVPNAKELHSIIDYSRIPAINPIFRLGDANAYLWSSTTHLETPPPMGTSALTPFTQQGELAVYAAVGPAMGMMEMPPGSGRRQWLDVHGAGAMRSDPKSAKPGKFPNGFGPQGDDIRGENLVLCVRNDQS